MQAEHIPVHLGSMPEAVAAVLDERAAPGRRLDPQRPLPRRHPPARHHPDLAGLRRRRRLLGFAASRAHHADVGGPTPGGMPADSTHARGGGRRDPADPRRRGRARASSPAQMRNPRQRLADLRAQRAANLVGERRLLELAERHGLDELRDGMDEILDYAERRTRAALAELPDGDLRGRGRARGRRRRRRRATSTLRRRARRSTATRCGSTSPAPTRRSTGNLNCPLSVTKSAAFFAVRVLTDPDAPPSAGRPPPDRGRARPRAACSTPARRPRSPPATSRPRAGSPTS